MEDHRGEIMIIFAGYTKEMEEFLKTNPGLTSRVPNKFVFEDYTPDEIVKIGLLGLHNAAYEVDEAAYADLVKNNYSLTSDHSNGRWVRNLNEELIMVMSERLRMQRTQILTRFCRRIWMLSVRETTECVH